MELLDLSKVVERDTIRLSDGKPYELRNPDDFGITEYAQLAHLQEQSRLLESEATTAKKLSPKKERELLDLLGETIKLLIPTAKPVLVNKLSKAEMERIILAWMGRHMTGDEPGEPVSRRTGAPSSRGSKRSTAATRARGSRSRSGS